jgi:sugar O-acyltransferase (sialic acid O-acetyltransferase NeuD family)
MILYGASGHGRVILDCLKRNQAKVLCFFDDNDKIADYCSLPVFRYNPSEYPDEKLIISIGDNGIRKNIARRVSRPFGNTVDPSAIIAGDVRIGKGTVVLHNAVVQSGTILGEHVIINTASSIDHECNIGNFSHIGPNATLCGNVTVGEGTQIGAAAVVIPGISVGHWSVIGAGAVVRETVPDNVVVAGNPGRIIKVHDR